jgi:hypothetical protein
VEAEAAADERIALEASHSYKGSIPRKTNRVVEGLVIVTDQNGLKHEDLDGQIVLVKGTSSEENRLELPVEGGRWSVDWMPKTKIAVEKLVLAGRPAVLDRPGERLSVGKQPVLVRAHFPPQIFLNVIDARTRMPLSPVTIVLATDWPLEELDHPGELGKEHPFSEGGSSPVVIFPPTEMAEETGIRCFVSSPGYAWGRIRLDMTGGGERTIELERGGGISVRPKGDLGGELMIRVRRADARSTWPCLETSIRGRERIELEGLLLGPYVVSAELGDWYEDAEELAAVPVDVVEGRTASVDLLIEPRPLSPDVLLSGVLVLPPEWKVRPTLDVESMHSRAGGFMDHIYEADRIKPRPGEAHAFEWSTRVPPGRYRLVVPDVWYAVAIDVGAAGRSDVRVIVPPPSSVSVELIDAHTGLPVTEDDIFVSFDICSEPGQVMGAPPVERDAATGRFELRVPEGEVTIRTENGRYIPSTRTELVGAGNNQFSFEVSPTCEIAILLRDGSTPIPIEEDWGLEPKPLAGTGQEIDTTTVEDPGRFHVDVPGRYRFVFPDIPGFEAIPPQIVQARLGKIVTHVVKLVRKR